MTIIFDGADKVYSLLGQVLLALSKLEHQSMTAADAVAKLTADFGTAATRVNTDLTTLNGQVTDLQTQVAALQAQIASGGDIPADVQTAVDALDASINALDVPAPVVVPPPPPVDNPPAPAPGPAPAPAPTPA